MIGRRVAKTETGLVRGLSAADPRITSFKGIPYAAPPVGENRWRPPQPARDWDGMLEAGAGQRRILGHRHRRAVLRGSSVRPTRAKPAAGRADFVWPHVVGIFPVAASGNAGGVAQAGRRTVRRGRR